MRQYLISVLALILLAGCVAPGPGSASEAPAVKPAAEAPAAAISAPAPEAARNGTLIRAMTSEPTQIDPQGSPSSGLSLVMPYLFDTLVVRDTDNSVHPLLAETWEMAEDGLSITMHLKSGVIFHDGSPLNAEAVKFTFDRFKEKGTRSPIYQGIQEIEAIEVVDELTVRFRFAAPAPTFWGTISMPYAGILSPENTRQVDATGEGNLVGAGPFVLGEWLPGQQLVLTANPDYAWGPDIVQNSAKPYLDQLIFKVIPDATTQLAALETGEVNVLFVNQPAQLQQLASNDQVRTEEMVLNSLIYLGYNCQQTPFDEVAVRQALSHAIDKAQIIDLALGGLGRSAFSPLPPSLPGFDPILQESELEYNPDRAKELLTEVGFVAAADGSWSRDGQQLAGRLLTSNRAPNGVIATLIQSQLKQIGVPMEIQELDSRAVMMATTEGAFDLLLWRFEWNDPDGLRIFLGSDAIGAGNRTKYSNPAVDELLNQAAHETDEAARSALYVQAQQLILQDAPWQPLYNPVDVMAVNRAVEGVKIGSMGRMLVNDAYVRNQ